MQLAIQMSMNNAAFKDDPYEAVHLLRDLADRMEDHVDNGGDLEVRDTWEIMDSNGNHVGTAKIQNDPVLIAELQAFEATRLPGGSLRYAAPEGQHDDTVIAAAIGLEAMTTRFNLQYQDANPLYS